MGRYSIRRKFGAAKYGRRSRYTVAKSRVRRQRRARAVAMRVDPGYTRPAGFYSGIENKFHEIEIDNGDTLIATAGVIAEDSVCGIAQGTTESERDGRKCLLNGINWRYSIEHQTAAAAGSTADVVRAILYLDKQCNGATAAVTDILNTGARSASTKYQSFNELANRSRFRILMDKMHVMTAPMAGNGTAVTVGSLKKHFSFYKKCKIPLEFSSTTGAITELRSNNIGVLLLSEAGLCRIDGVMRLRFTG